MNLAVIFVGASDDAHGPTRIDVARDAERWVVERVEEFRSELERQIEKLQLSQPSTSNRFQDITFQNPYSTIFKIDNP